MLLWLLAFLPLSAQETIDLSGSWDVAYGDSARYDGYALLPISIFSDEKASSETDSTRIWYRRSVYVPDSWRKHHVSLFLERPGTEITVYVNGTKAGSGTSFFAPQQFDISSSIRAGERNAIEVCVEHPSKCWDGISGRMELRAQSRNIYIRQVRLRPFPFDGIIQFDLTLDGSFSAFYNDYGQVLLQREGVDTARVISHYFELNNSHVLVNMFVGNQVALWDEFHPNLYRIGIAVANDYYETTFGMRQITYGDNHLLMNRYPLYLRGTEIDRHFLSTSSAVDESYWTGVFRRFKDCGLNFVRFRSCSPTEEAFTAADKVGIYLQPEGPSWPESGMTSGGERPSDELLLEESRRLIDTYGHHPSFLMMGSGCDSVKDGGGYCHKWVKEMMGRMIVQFFCGSEVKYRSPRAFGIA